MYILKFILREKERERERKFESKHISHVSVFKKSNIFLIAVPHLYSVSVVL